MATSANFNKAVYASIPILKSVLSSVSATTDFTIPVSSVEEIHECLEDAGNIVERLTIVSGCPVGSANTAQLILICIYNPDLAEWHIYKTLNLPSVTVSDTVSPAFVEHKFNGGLLLKKSWKVGIARTQNGGGNDNLHIILEGGDFSAI